MNPLLSALIGGLITGLITLAGIFFQASSVRRKRMDEVTAERKVDADAKAYDDMKMIASLLTRNKPAWDIIQWMESRQSWFFSSRIFLPGKYPAKWLSIRNELMAFHSLHSPGNPGLRVEINLTEHLLKLAAEAIDEVYKDIGLERIVIERPSPDGARLS